MTQIFGQNFQRLRTSGRHYSATLQIDEISQPNRPSTGFPLSILPLESIQSHSLVSRLRTRSVPSKFLALIVYLFIASWSIYRQTL